jgi:hypothetical protein
MKRSLQLCILALSTSFLLTSYAPAESFPLSGTASFGNDSASFTLSGPLIFPYSAAPGGQGSPIFQCTLGMVCPLPQVGVGAFQSCECRPGEFSGDTVDGIKAYSLEGGLLFSGTTFTASMDPSNLGTGTVTFNGTIRGFVFNPPGCEQVLQSCTGDGPQVFNFHVTGTATITLSGEIADNDGLVNVSGAKGQWSCDRSARAFEFLAAGIAFRE